MSKMENDLVKVTGVKPERDRAAFLKKLTKAALTMEEDKWEALSTDAQEWVNSNARAIKANKPLSDFDAAAKAPEPKAKVEAKPKAEPKKPEARTRDKDAPYHPPAKLSKLLARFNGKAPDPYSLIKIMAIADPECRTRDIHAMLKSKGHKMSMPCISVIRSHFRHGVRVLQHVGLADKTLKV